MATRAFRRKGELPHWGVSSRVFHHQTESIVVCLIWVIGFAISLNLTALTLMTLLLE